MLTYLFKCDPDRWRVIGITENALLKFKENNFEYKTGIKIQRAHLNNRSDVYLEMLAKKFDNCNDWWEFYYQNDETILVPSPRFVPPRNVRYDLCPIPNTLCIFIERHVRQGLRFCLEVSINF